MPRWDDAGGDIDTGPSPPPFRRARKLAAALVWPPPRKGLLGLGADRLAMLAAWGMPCTPVLEVEDTRPPWWLWLANDRWWLWLCNPERDVCPASMERDDGCRLSPSELAA